MRSFYAGTANGLNTTSHYVGSFEFALTENKDEKLPDSASIAGAPRSALNSESSVLVVENKAFSDIPVQAHLLQIADPK